MSNNSPMVTVVSGLPRSGTSMLMRMLEAGGMPLLVDQSRMADEDNLDGYYEFEAVKRLERDASWMPMAAGRAVKVIAFLLTYLPPTFQYRILFLERRLSEVLASQRAMLQRKIPLMADDADRRIGQIYLEHLRSIRDWLSQQPNMEVLYLDYNDLLADPGPGIERIRAFLNTTLDSSAMRMVISPVRYRQRLGADSDRHSI